MTTRNGVVMSFQQERRTLPHRTTENNRMQMLMMQIASNVTAVAVPEISRALPISACVSLPRSCSTDDGVFEEEGAIFNFMANLAFVIF